MLRLSSHFGPSVLVRLSIFAALVAVLALLVNAPSANPALADGPANVWGPRAVPSGARVAALPVGCPSTPDFSFSGTDPVGDDFGFGTPSHDIIGWSVVGDATMFCLTIDFGGPVTPADSGSPDALAGVVEFDVDEDPATGFFPYVDSFCPDRAGISIEVALDLFTVSGGTASMFPSGNLVPVTFGPTSLTAEIPMSELGDSAFNFASVLGTPLEPTDCVPNGGSTHSPDGSFVPAPPLPDTDGDGIPDIFDNCPTTPNPGQEDSDFDFIGDVCDPTPDHDVAIAGGGASNVTINLDRVGNGTLNGHVTVQNFRNYPEEVFIDVFVDGLPTGCEITALSGENFGTVRRLGKKTFSFSANITCRPGLAAPGTYVLTANAFVFPTRGMDADESNNFGSANSTLRIR